jgi:hypothetical protein
MQAIGLLDIRIEAIPARARHGGAKSGDELILRENIQQNERRQATNLHELPVTQPKYRLKTSLQTIFSCIPAGYCSIALNMDVA